MVVLGIDPGLAIVGYGVINSIKNNYEPIAYGVIRTDKGIDTSTRLYELSIKLERIIDKYNPDVVAIEQLFFFKNAKTVITVAEARGVIILTALKGAKTIAEYTPLEVKQAITGYGSADKKQVQQMVRILLKLDHTPKPDDAADALAIALCHCQSAKIKGIKLQ